MRLPNPAQAIVETQKLVGYCLNPEHSDGQHKAIIFRSALGIGLAEAEELQQALLQAVRIYDATPGNASRQGQNMSSTSPLSAWRNKP
jgi:hypothetical protein